MANAVKNTQSPAVDSAERRAFYRVNDAVALRVTVLDDDALTQFQDALEQRRSSGQDTDSGAHAHVIWRCRCGSSRVDRLSTRSPKSFGNTNDVHRRRRGNSVAPCNSPIFCKVNVKPCSSTFMCCKWTRCARAHSRPTDPPQTGPFRLAEKIAAAACAAQSR